MKVLIVLNFCASYTKLLQYMYVGFRSVCFREDDKTKLFEDKTQFPAIMKCALVRPYIEYLTMLHTATCMPQ